MKISKQNPAHIVNNPSTYELIAFPLSSLETTDQTKTNCQLINKIIN